MMTEQLAQPRSMHRRAQRTPIRTLYGRGMEAREPLSGHDDPGFKSYPNNTGLAGFMKVNDTHCRGTALGANFPEATVPVSADTDCLASTGSGGQSIPVSLRAAGTTSLRGIAAELNNRGIPTATGTGTWQSAQVRRLLARLA